MTATIARNAGSAAVAAADRAGVTIDAITDAEQAHRASKLLCDIWATAPDQPIVAPEIIRTIAHINSYGVLATASDDVVGVALGFFGEDLTGAFLHSYVAGVAVHVRGANVGFALKQHQRAWALERGVARITWTFDPLVRRNAYFNLVKLGAAAVAYHPDFYGSMRDGVNLGDTSDRILIEWDLVSAGAIAASVAPPRAVDRAASGDIGGVVRLRVGPGDEPQLSTARGAAELVQIPEDIVALRRRDPDLARRWRVAVGETLGATIDDGGRVDEFTRDGWYVVRRSE